jgi:oxygen-dependent protoporphyrinogen oxidase
MPNELPHHVILGAGISGLSLAWFLRKRYGDSIQLTIIESSLRPGGWIESRHQDGFLFEQGPRSCRPYGNGVETLRLIEDLGLQSQVIHASKAAYRRYLFLNGSLKALPTGPFSLFYNRFTPALLKAFWKDWRAPKGNGDETIAQFAERRLGKHAAELFFDPLIAGIYAGDMKKLSIVSCFPKLWEWEQQHGSLLKGAFSRGSQKEQNYSPWVADTKKKGLFTLQDGMETLTTTLGNHFQKNLRLGQKAIGLSFHSGKALVSLSDESSIAADHLYSTITPSALAALLTPSSPVLACLIGSIPSVSVGLVNIGYDKLLLPHSGFGHLIPSKEQEDILGMVWDSSAFPSQNRHPEQTRLTVMIGHSHLPTEVSEREHILKNTALRAVEKQLKIFQNPTSISVKIAHQAIPQYYVGHEERLKHIENELNKLPAPVSLLGNGFYGVAVNDCIARARIISEY